MCWRGLGREGIGFREEGSPAPLAEGGWIAFWGLLFSVRKMPFSSLFSLLTPGHLGLREGQPERHVVAMATEHLNKTWYPKKAREAWDQTRKGSMLKEEMGRA